MITPLRTVVCALVAAAGLLGCADAVSPPADQTVPGARYATLLTSDVVSTVTSQAASNLCLDVDGGSTANGTRLIVWTCHGGANQSFTWTPAGQVKAYGTTCTDASGGSDGDWVVIWACQGGTDQQWRLTSAGEIRGLNDKCATIAGTASAGTPLTIQTCDGRATQKWVVPGLAAAGATAPSSTSPANLVPTTTIVAPVNSQAGSNLCLDVPGGSTANGTRLIVWTCHGGTNQAFTWTPTGEVKAYGTICMNATGGSDGDWMVISGCNSSQNQQWHLTSAGEIRGLNDKCATIAGTATAGTALSIQTCDGRATQKWAVAGLTTAGATSTSPVVDTALAITAPPVATLPSVGVVAPELPRTYVNSALVAPTGRTITVRAGDNLQSAIDAALPGDVLLLQAGARFVGNFVLPVKSGTGWITIRSAASDASLPSQGVRITPSYASQLPKLVSMSVAPALATAPGAHNYRILGVELTTESTTGFNYGIVTLGEGGGSIQTSLSDVPHDIVLDRVYVHGSATLDVRRCVALNSAATAIVDSWLSDCHSLGWDSQAIAGWNGPGPFKIVNNYLEGAGENIMFGGSDPSIPNLIPSDIEIRRNHVFKPLSWQGVWGIKNLLELKNARRVLIEGNVFENNWQGAQVGFAILMKSVNQDGTAPWSQTSDVTFQYNAIRRVAGGLSLAGRPEANPAVRMTRIRIANNSWEQVGDASLGSVFSLSRMYQIEATENLELAHNTSNATVHGLILTGDPVAGGFSLRDNVFDGGPGINSADGKGVGGDALNYYYPGWFARGNVIGTSYAPTRLAPFPTGNTYVPNGQTAGATATTTDGKPLGVDRATLDQRIAGVVVSR